MITRVIELMALLGGQQVQLPQFQASAPIDVLGPEQLALTGQLAQFNAEQANQQAALGGLFGLGSAGLLGLLLRQ